MTTYATNLTATDRFFDWVTDSTPGLILFGALLLPIFVILGAVIGVLFLVQISWHLARVGATFGVLYLVIQTAAPDATLVPWASFVIAPFHSLIGLIVH